MSKHTGHDPQCGELADYFLGGDLFAKDNRDDLADAIQDAVERWFEDHACPVCGNQERDHRGLLSCECPCPSTLEKRRQIAEEMKAEGVALEAQKSK